jgi:hypothetical protein
VLLAACSGEPRRIASYPSSSGVSSGAGAETYTGQRVYRAFLELEVADVEAAAEKAEELAYEYGGSLYSSHFWEAEGKTCATLVIEIPNRQFERLRVRLLRLGSLKSESTLGEWREVGGGWESEIILSLRPAAASWPRVDLPGWRPAATFRRALGVFLSIAGFLLDILIWLTVVVGPFVLLGWGLAKLITRQHR